VNIVSLFFLDHFKAIPFLFFRLIKVIVRIVKVRQLLTRREVISALGRVFLPAQVTIINLLLLIIIVTAARSMLNVTEANTLRLNFNVFAYLFVFRREHWRRFELHLSHIFALFHFNVATVWS